MQDGYNKRGAEHQNTQPDPQMVSAVTAAVIQALQNNENELRQPGRKHSGASNEPKTIDLIGLIFYVIEKFWIVLLAAIIGAGFFGARANNSVPIYTATAKLYIVNPDTGGISLSDLQLGTVLQLDYQEVFKTWEVHEMVREELNLPYSYSAMQSMVTVTNPEDTRILYISVRFTDAQMAANIANAYAKAAKEFITTTMRGEEPSNFSIALVPGVAQVTSKSREMIKGFLLGSVLAAGLLALLFVLDERPRTPEHISAAAGIPTLAVLPSRREMKRFHNNTRSTSKGGRRG